jgi:hypothetical protein
MVRRIMSGVRAAFGGDKGGWEEKVAKSSWNHSLDKRRRASQKLCIIRILDQIAA